MQRQDLLDTFDLSGRTAIITGGVAASGSRSPTASLRSAPTS